LFSRHANNQPIAAIVSSSHWTISTIFIDLELTSNHFRVGTFSFRFENIANNEFRSSITIRTTIYRYKKPKVVFFLDPRLTLRVRVNTLAHVIVARVGIENTCILPTAGFQSNSTISMLTRSDREMFVLTWVVGHFVNMKFRCYFHSNPLRVNFFWVFKSRAVILCAMTNGMQYMIDRRTGITKGAGTFLENLLQLLDRQDNQSRHSSCHDLRWHLPRC